MRKEVEENLLQYFYSNFPEFFRNGVLSHECPYCDKQVGYDPVQLCCSEVHGRWVFNTDRDSENSEAG